MNVEAFKETLKEYDDTYLTDIIIHPKHYEEIMRFQEPTKWELFLDGFHNFWNCLECYDDSDADTWGYDEFWEGLSMGWMQTYIWDYDDPFNPTISPERKLRLDQKPPVIYVSEEAYDALVEAINKPPEYNEKIARVLSRKAPWEDERKV